MMIGNDDVLAIRGERVLAGSRNKVIRRTTDREERPHERLSRSAMGRNSTAMCSNSVGLRIMCHPGPTILYWVMVGVVSNLAAESRKPLERSARHSDIVARNSERSQHAVRIDTANTGTSGEPPNFERSAGGLWTLIAWRRAAMLRPSPLYGITSVKI